MAVSLQYRTLVWLGIFALVAVRLAVAAVAPLAFDEAYYWLWSKNLAGGYYDHPPAIALAIRLGTMAIGDTPLGIRLVGILLALPATWAVWRSGALLFGNERLAATAALFFNLTLMVAAGSVLATPDAMLLAASAFVLFFLAKLIGTGHGRWWLAVGVAVGAALLSKYTALFFGVSILAWLLIVPRMRRWLLTPWPYLGGLTALTMFLPVILWNAEHGWVSFLKQFGRSALSDWQPQFLPEHIVVQLALATPPIFVLGAMGLASFLKERGRGRSARVLLGALVWPLTLYFVWFALRGRVEGNWTAPVFPAIAVVAAAAAHGIGWTGIWAALTRFCDKLAAPVGLFMAAAVYLQAVFGIIPLGAIDPSARQLGAGWRELGAEIDALRQQNGARAVLTTSYALTGWLSYYLPSRPPVVQINERIRWVNAPPPDPALFFGVSLYVCQTECNDLDLLRARYGTVRELARVTRKRRGVEIDTYQVFRVENLRGDPLDRTPPPELRR
jgi:4-amino-4-deoxy-L-arabinose transferase-like glycosyltransferase